MITTPRAALKAIFARLANLPACNVTWKGEPEPSTLKPPSSVAITGATNASPIVLTVPQGLVIANRSSLVVAGVGGNTAANGTWPSVTVVDATHVSLDGSVGNGAYTSGGTIAPLSAWRWGVLRIGSSSREADGWDDTTMVDNGDGTFSETTHGPRRVILALDYFSHDPSAAVLPDDVLEDLRTKLWHGNILDAFTAAQSCPVTYGNVIPLTAIINGREIPAAHLDVVVRLAAIDTQVTDRDALGGKNNWIHEVKATGTVTKESGGTETEPLDVVGN